MAALVRAEDFYVPAHRAIWSAIASIDQKHQPIDRTTVLQELESEQTLQLLQSSGGRQFIDPRRVRGHNARTLAKYPDLRVVLVVMQESAFVRTLSAIQSD